MKKTPLNYRPILFSTLMVQAILEGRKTMTRRAVKPQPPSPQGEFPAKWKFNYWAGSPFKNGQEKDPERFGLIDGIGKAFTPSNNYGKPGDVLWVRESIYAHPAFSAKDSGPLFDESGNAVAFRGYIADGNYTKPFKKIPSIHMPFTACRIFLEVTGVRVERLQDISQEDSGSEGVFPAPHRADENCGKWNNPLQQVRDCNYCAFKILWQSINGPDSWKENPWVWVVEFKRIEKPTTL